MVASGMACNDENACRLTWMPYVTGFYHPVQVVAARRR